MSKIERLCAALGALNESLIVSKWHNNLSPDQWSAGTRWGSWFGDTLDDVLTVVTDKMARYWKARLREGNIERWEIIQFQRALQVLASEDTCMEPQLADAGVHPNRG